MTTTSSLHRLRTLNHAFSRFTLAALLFAGGFALAAAQSSAPLRLLFDDYYQKIRDDSLYQQGVARGDADLRNLSNFYSPDANAIPNGRGRRVVYRNSSRSGESGLGWPQHGAVA